MRIPVKGFADYMKNTTYACMRCIVYGGVQGVFFRASTKKQALQSGITGYARNLPDGCVEVVACGQLPAVEELKDWLQYGPETATVSAVQCEPIPRQNFSDFLTL